MDILQIEPDQDKFVSFVKALFEKDVLSYQFLINTLDDSPESGLMEKCGILTSEKVVPLYKLKSDTADREILTQVYSRVEHDKFKRSLKFKTFYT